MFKRGVDFKREGWIPGISHIVMKKGSTFWREGGVDSRKVAYLRMGIF